jgi:hypothetical protein
LFLLHLIRYGELLADNEYRKKNPCFPMRF